MPSPRAMAAAPALATLRALPLLPLALLLSLLFSLLLTLANSQLNDDAFSYLRAAERFQQDGLASVLQDYGWYGYSILIALADTVLPGGLLASAQVLNALCYLLLTGSFIALQRELGAGPRQLWLAAGVVLLFPLLNEMRSYIIRDVACWAFMLLALLQLLRFARAPILPRALAWCGCLLLAAVFRLEVLLTALLAPAALLWAAPTRSAGLCALLQLYGCLLACSLVVLGLALAAGVQLPELMRFAWRYYLPLLLDFGNVLRADVLALNASLFTPQNFPGSGNLAVGLLILVFAWVASVLLNLVGALGLPFTLLLVLLCRQRRIVLSRGAMALWWVHVATALLALLLFQAIMHFQTQRYATLLALLLLLLVPVGLEHWWQQAERQGTARRFRRVLALCCFYLAADSLVSFGHSKQHLEQAEAWVMQELPASASFATNSFQLAWRSGRIPDYDKVLPGVDATLQATPASEFLAFDLKRSDTAARAQLDADPALEPVQQFSNERGDEVRIYRRRQP